MPDGSTFPYGAHTGNPLISRPGPAGMQHVTPEMQVAGARALAAKYIGVAFGSKDKPLVRDNESALGIAAATAFLAMEQVSEYGPRDHLQHSGLFGGSDPLGWQGTQPVHRADHIQEAAPDFLLGTVTLLKMLCAPQNNPVQNAAIGAVASSLTALATELRRAAAVRRRVASERKDSQRLNQAVSDELQDAARQRENEARAARRRRAKERQVTSAGALEAGA